MEGGGGRWLVRWVGGRAGVTEFFYYESKFKIKIKKNIFFGGGVWGGRGRVGERGGAIVSEFFYTESKSKKNFLGGGRGGGGRWTDRRTGPIQFAPSFKFFKVGGIRA